MSLRDIALESYVVERDKITKQFVTNAKYEIKKILGVSEDLIYAKEANQTEAIFKVEDIILKAEKDDDYDMHFHLAYYDNSKKEYCVYYDDLILDLGDLGRLLLEENKHQN